MKKKNASHIRRIFLGYAGRSRRVAAEVKDFLQSQCRNCTVLDWLVDFRRGHTIIEEIERTAHRISGAVFLITKDDEFVTSRHDIAGRKYYPRDNIVFEVGFFAGRLGRRRVACLVERGVEIPSDLLGVLYIPLSKLRLESTCLQLARHLGLQLKKM